MTQDERDMERAVVQAARESRRIEKRFSVLKADELKSWVNWWRFVFVECGPRDFSSVSDLRAAICERWESLERTAREEGRREILREVARLKPDDYAGEEGDCNFCHAHIMHGGPHKPRCLWLRAKRESR